MTNPHNTDGRIASIPKTPWIETYGLPSWHGGPRYKDRHKWAALYKIHVDGASKGNWAVWKTYPSRESAEDAVNGLNRYYALRSATSSCAGKIEKLTWVFCGAEIFVKEGK